MSSMKAFFMLSFPLISALLIVSHVCCESGTEVLPTHLHPSKHFGHADECHSLLQFKNSLAINKSISNSACLEYGLYDPSFLGTASWKEGSDCCTGWDGITCDNVTGSVISVNLTCSYLEGNLHSVSSLFSLRHLAELSLGGNHISGHIPSSICQLSSLENLILADCNLNGTIPPCLGTNMSNLELLALGDNQFHGQLPPDYFQHSKLSVISLEHNMFDGFLPIPPITAQYYEARDNSFRGEISSSFCANSTTLVGLDLSNNNLSGEIPQCLVTSPKIERLFLSNNKFHGPIPEIPARNNCSFKSIILRNNHLHGKLPPSWALCKQLKTLDISHNELEDSFPVWLEALQDLSVLILRSNKFYGPITSASKAVHPFPLLQIFDISNNNFNGALPTHYISNFNSMMGGDREGVLQFHASYWTLSERATVIYKGVEIELEKIREALVIIDLSYNHFQDEIPNFFGNLQLLKGLNLSHNNLRGVIPSSLGNLTNLEWLDLSSNNIIGEIPAALTSLTSLAILNLSMNHLTGEVPRGKQFDTFRNDSYRGNPGLCGLPLSNPCSRELPAGTPSEPQNEDEADSWMSRWIAVLMGYGIGTVIGILIGYIFIEIRRPPMWLIKMVKRWRTRR